MPKDEDEIEVTDVMIAAGRTILAGHDPVSGRSERLLLPELFLAMWAARLSGDHIE